MKICFPFARSELCIFAKLLVMGPDLRFLGPSPSLGRVCGKFWKVFGCRMRKFQWIFKWANVLIMDWQKLSSTVKTQPIIAIETNENLAR